MVAVGKGVAVIEGVDVGSSGASVEVGSSPGSGAPPLDV